MIKCRNWWLSAGTGGSVQDLVAQCRNWRLSAGTSGSVQELVAQCRNWWLSAGTGSSVQELAAQCRNWWLSAGTGGSVQELVAQCRNWWLGAGTDGSVQELMAQCKNWWLWFNKRAMRVIRSCRSLQKEQKMSDLPFFDKRRAIRFAATPYTWWTRGGLGSPSIPPTAWAASNWVSSGYLKIHRAHILVED